MWTVLILALALLLSLNISVFNNKPDGGRGEGGLNLQDAPCSFEFLGPLFLQRLPANPVFLEKQGALLDAQLQ